VTRVKLHQLESFLEWSQKGHSFAEAVLIGLDLTEHTALLAERDVRGLVLLGCHAPPDLLARLVERGALFFPPMPGLPYQPFRGQLYTVDELFDPPNLLRRCREDCPNAYTETLDGRIYQHFCRNGRSSPHEITESLAQRLHDHSITEGIEALIAGRCVVGIMGGHSLQRHDDAYRRIALLSRALTREGFFMVSGGGPGAMEACHLGVYFVDRSEHELDTALEMLRAAPDYHGMNEWLLTGLEVRLKFPPPDPQRAQSLGVPTWYFGHEPPNMFASHVGKYFANSVREDGLVTIARHGLVFAKGSAGTIQEIFQDQTQNYYLTEGEPSPMILLGEDYWKWRRPIYSLLCSMAAGRPHDNHLHITDHNEEVVAILKQYRSTYRLIPAN
jgi:predicted Rossmann-fold nucleotide-binding protein